MGKRSKRPTNNYEGPDQRPVWLAIHEVEVLLGLLIDHKDANRKMPVTKKLLRCRREFDDNALRLREMLVRVKANAFWEEDRGRIIVKKLREGARKRVRKAEKRIKALTPRQMTEVIKELRRMPKEKMDDNADSRVPNLNGAVKPQEQEPRDA